MTEDEKQEILDSMSDQQADQAMELAEAEFGAEDENADENNN